MEKIKEDNKHCNPELKSYVSVKSIREGRSIGNPVNSEEKISSASDFRPPTTRRQGNGIKNISNQVARNHDRIIMWDETLLQDLLLINSR